MSAHPFYGVGADDARVRAAAAVVGVGTHTPGPWGAGSLFHRSITIYSRVSRGGANLSVASVGSTFNGPDDVERVEADACLIAAAPDLLAALGLAHRQLVAAFGEPDGSALSSKAGEAAIYAARAAIAKATS